MPLSGPGSMRGMLMWSAAEGADVLAPAVAGPRDALVPAGELAARAVRAIWRPGHLFPAAGVGHGVPAVRPAAPGSRGSHGVPAAGQAERGPGDPAGPAGAARDQHPSRGQL